MSRGRGKPTADIPIAAILKEYEAWTGDIVDAVSRELLAEVRKNAATAFADKTGYLRKSIKRMKSKYDKGSVLVISQAPHSHLIEYGHNITVTKKGEVIGHVPARPYMTTAEEAIRARLPEIVKRVVEPVVEVQRT